jgi:hypothetical protein
MHSIHDSEERRLAEELTREVIAETAPEEMVDFDRLVAEYHRNPSMTQGAPGGGDDPLGFGMDSGLLSLSTPLVMSIATQVIAYFRTEVLTLAKDEAAASIRQKIRTFLQSASKEQPPGGAPVPAPTAAVAQEPPPQMDFSRDQLLKIQKIARSEAKRRGASEEEALHFANALIGRLAVAGP